MKSIIPVNRSAVVLAAAVFAVASHVSAQVYVQNGNAQDANNLVGSGGSNTPIQGFVPSNPNIYGMQNSGAMFNPAGTSQFSRVVPVPLPGGGTTYAQIPVVGQSSFYAPTSSPSQLRLSSVNAVSQGISSLAVNQAVNGAVNPNQGFSASVGVGLGAQSSLRGIGSISQVNAPMTASGQYSPFVNNNVSLPANIGMYSGLSSRSNGRINPLFGLRTIRSPYSPTGLRNHSAIQKARRKSSLMINGRVKSRRESGTFAGPHRIAAVGRRKQALVGYVRSRHVPSGDYYQQLLRELSTGRRSKIIAPGIGGRRAIINTTLAPVNAKTANQLMIDPITGLPIAPITARRRVGKMQNLSQQAPGGARNGLSPSSPAAQQNWLNPKKVKALRAGRHFHVLSTLAGPAPTEFNRFMKRGQIDLKHARYVGALYRFNSALILEPRNALARIARGNTELLGGMYASALSDFKTVFARHPQMAAVRYNFHLMLAPKALAKTQRDLAAMFTDHSDAAAFLLSYTYYQSGRQAELRRTLSTWSSWGTGGLWPSILAKAWLTNPKTH